MSISRSQHILAQNIATLLRARRASARDLAFYAGHKPAWLSKILKGTRGVGCADLDRIADFFGLTVADLFSYGISPKLERRKTERRAGKERRSGEDRRAPSHVRRLYGDLPKVW